MASNLCPFSSFSLSGLCALTSRNIYSVSVSASRLSPFPLCLGSVQLLNTGAASIRQAVGLSHPAPSGNILPASGAVQTGEPLGFVKGVEEGREETPGKADHFINANTFS